MPRKRKPVEATIDNFDKVKLILPKVEGASITYKRKKYSKNIGHCRYVYKIDNIIIKFDFSPQKIKNYGGGDCYRQTPNECKFYKKIDKKDKKYFPRIISFKKNGRVVEVQEFITGSRMNGTTNGKAIEKVRELQKKYKRRDYHDGNIIVHNKTPIVVDFGL